jgi:hypothetical protein
VADTRTQRFAQYADLCYRAPWSFSVFFNEKLVPNIHRPTVSIDTYSVLQVHTVYSYSGRLLWFIIFSGLVHVTVQYLGTLHLSGIMVELSSSVTVVDALKRTPRPNPQIRRARTERPPLRTAEVCGAVGIGD